MKPLKLAGLATALALVSFDASAQPQINIGVPNWPAARGVAAILEAVIEKELGGKAETVPGNNPVIWKAMHEGKGDIDVHPDSWMPNQLNFKTEYVDEKKTVALNTKPYIAKQGMCVPKYVKEKYGVNSVYDLAKPEVVKAFDVEGKGKPEAWLGATGWASTNVMRVQARDYGWAPFYSESNIDETLLFGRLDDYYKNKRPILFYCYKPHWTSLKYDLVMLQEPPHNASCYKMVQPQEDPDWFNKSKVTCAMEDVAAHVAYSKSLENRAPAAAKLLATVSFTSEQMSEITEAMAVKKMNENEFAAQWRARNQHSVKQWLGLAH
jgi:glycine betaine/proline transport system substrate-binding protein